MAQRLDIDPAYEKQWGWRDPDTYVFKPERGLDRKKVEEISFMKSEPEWMRKFRLKSFDRWEKRPMPSWGADLSGIDFDQIYYFLRATDRSERSWDDVPTDIKNTFDRLGIPEAEQKYLGGVSAQYECLRGSTLVWTIKGQVAIKSVQPGDQVFSLDETSRQLVVSKIIGQRCSGEKEILEIKARGRTIGASANHPFLVLKDERKPGRKRARFYTRWVPAGDLSPGDLVAVPTDTPEFGEPAELLTATMKLFEGFPTHTSEDFCWWAGVFLGDGYFHNRGEYVSVEIAVDRTDEELVNDIIRVSHELFGLDFVLAKDGFRLCAKGTQPLAEFLQLNGLGGTARTKRVPDWGFGLTKGERLALLGGFVDADGYVRAHPENQDVVMTSVNEQLLADIKEIKTLCGITEPVVDDPDIRSHTSDMLGFVRIEEIVVSGVEPTYDIEVEDHHNFVADGYIVHNSETVYHSIKESLTKQGVLFTDMDTALKEHPEIVQKYFATIIPPNDNKLAALNSAVWSGGSFVYVPPGVKVDIPLQAYFRINAESMGQFERTLIIADEGSYVHYVEGCTAPSYSSASLHSAVVELIALSHSRIRYTTIQNWAGNVYNLVTKRARAEEGAVVEWVDGNLGSRVTMKYPAVVLAGRKAHGEVLSLAMAGKGQHQDTGAKMTHLAPETSSTIISKSISKDGGRTSYRGGVWVKPGAYKSKSNVVCDALLIDEDSISDTYPYIDIHEQDVTIGHEATVARIGDEQMFYLQSRGIPQAEAAAMIVRGFIEPIAKQLPMEFAVELNRLIELEMEGSVG